MNLGEVITRVTRVFGDETGAQIDEADIARWATDAQRDVVRETKCNQTTSTDTLVQNQDEYVIQASLSLSQVTVSGIALRSITRGELNQRYPDRAATPVTGTPQFFTARSGSVGTIVTLYPAPDSISAGSELSITHNTRPSPVVNPSDVFSVPEEYMDIIVSTCLERAYEMDGQWNAASIKKSQSAEGMNTARGDSREQDDDSYPAIRCLPGDMG